MTCFTSEEKSSHYFLLIVCADLIKNNDFMWHFLPSYFHLVDEEKEFSSNFKKYLTLIELQVKMTSGLTFKKYANKAKVITTLRFRPKRENVCFSLAYVINVTIFRTVYYLTEYKTHSTKKKWLSLLRVRSWFVVD
jgi:hypothetical protein